MQEQKINFETAKLAKEKGFNVGVGTCYVRYNKTHKHSNPSFNTKKGAIETEEGYFKNNGQGDLSNPNYTCYARPSQALLQAWIRGMHGMNIKTVACNVPLKGKWVYEIESFPDITDVYIWDFEKSVQYNTYEEALEAGLVHVLNLI